MYSTFLYQLDRDITIHFHRLLFLCKDKTLFFQLETDFYVTSQAESIAIMLVAGISAFDIIIQLCFWSRVTVG